MKKKILSFALAICLIIPAMFMLSACGNSETPYNKTFVFSEAQINYDNSFNGTLLGDYISQNLKNINWVDTLNEANFSEEVQTLERAKELLQNKANAVFSQRFNDFKIIISSESEHKITLGSQEYTFETKPSGNLQVISNGVLIAEIDIDIAQNKLRGITPTFIEIEGVVSSFPDSSYPMEIKLNSGEDTYVFANPQPVFKIEK